MALALREAGPPDAPCLVFLHGLWMSSSMWQPQIERLCEDYHCLAPDLPEHGKSTEIGLLTRSNTSRVVANSDVKRARNGRGALYQFRSFAGLDRDAGGVTGPGAKGPAIPPALSLHGGSSNSIVWEVGTVFIASAKLQPHIHGRW